LPRDPSLLLPNLPDTQQSPVAGGSRSEGVLSVDIWVAPLAASPAAAAAAATATATETATATATATATKVVAEVSAKPLSTYDPQRTALVGSVVVALHSTPFQVGTDTSAVPIEFKNKTTQASGVADSE
jgi:hypothetical protein